MINIAYDNEWGLEFPKEVQIRRILRVMEKELTQIERQTLELYHFRQMRQVDIARLQGVHPSTVLRNLRRAEEKLRKHLRY